MASSVHPEGYPQLYDEWLSAPGSTPQTTSSNEAPMLTEEPTFVHPSQVFQQPLGSHDPHPGKIGMQRHLSLNLPDSHHIRASLGAGFDHPPSLSPMTLHDQAFPTAAYPSPGIHDSRYSSNATAMAPALTSPDTSTVSRPTTRHRHKRSLSANDLSSVFNPGRQEDQRHQTAQQPPNTASVPTKPQSSNSSFIGKLWNMLHDDTEHAFLISFSTTGSSFVISNAGEFAKTILPKHFKHNNFSSFVRQLNMYGFSKLNKTARGMRGAPESQVWEFSHPKFHRDRPDLLDTIRRKTMEDSNTTTIAVPISPSSARLHQTRSASAEAAAAKNDARQHATWSSPSDMQPPRTSASPQSTPVTPGSSMSASQPSFPQHAPPPVHHESPEFSHPVHSQAHSLPMPTQPQPTSSSVHYYDMLHANQGELGRYISDLQQNCRSLRELVDDSRRKQGVLIDVVGQLYNHAQQTTSGQLQFDFPSVLQEEAFASAAVSEMPPIIVDSSRATLPPHGSHNHASRAWDSNPAPQTAPLNSSFFQPATGPGPLETMPTPASMPNSPMFPDSTSQQQQQQQPNPHLLGLGVRYDGRPSALHEGSSSDLSSGGESDFSESMMQ